jgi:hypothetical protein
MVSNHSKKHNIIHNKTRKKGGIHIIRHFTPLTAINHFITPTKKKNETKIP